MADLPDAEIDLLVSTARRVFARWGLPEPCAFRAGNLRVDRRIYAALARHGIRLSSNVGVGIHRPADPALDLTGGRHWIDGVLEVPVTSYRDLRLGRWQHWKTFTIVGTGAREAEELLARAAEIGAGSLVILTHPSEFVKRVGDGCAELRHNHLSRTRLDRLCKFLVANGRRFRVTTFAGGVNAWTRQETTAPPTLNVSLLAAARRFVENRRNDGRA